MVEKNKERKGRQEIKEAKEYGSRDKVTFSLTVIV